MQYNKGRGGNSRIPGFMTDKKHQLINVYQLIKIIKLYSAVEITVLQIIPYILGDTHICILEFFYSFINSMSVFEVHKL